MMPSEYMAHAIDYDGDGKRNLIKSASDVIAPPESTSCISDGNAASRGWECACRSLPWKEADLSVQHPRSKWAAGDAPTASHSRTTTCQPRCCCRWDGSDAFLAYDNFQAYLKWNDRSLLTAAAYYATRLDGAPPMNKGSANIPKITFEETASCRNCCKSASVTSVASMACSASRAGGGQGLQIKSASRPTGGRRQVSCSRVPAGDRRGLRPRRTPSSGQMAAAGRSSTEETGARTSCRGQQKLRGALRRVDRDFIGRMISNCARRINLRMA
jgi:hypothetical protein